MPVSVCVCVLPKSRNGRPHSSESLNRWHRDQRSGSVQMSYWLVTAWTRPLHFPACCSSRLTPRCGLGEQKWVTIENDREKMKYRTQYTHPSASEMSSNWVLCSGCPFSAGFSLYCWTSWATWFSWFNTLFSINIFTHSQNLLQTGSVNAPSSLTKAISRVLLPISLSTWWSSRLSCSLETTAELTPPTGHLGCCWAATAWLWQGCTGCPANALASLCIIKELLAACHTRENAKRLSIHCRFFLH